jgi:hypothetical protein
VFHPLHLIGALGADSTEFSTGIAAPSLYSDAPAVSESQSASGAEPIRPGTSPIGRGCENR